MLTGARGRERGLPKIIDLLNLALDIECSVGLWCDHLAKQGDAESARLLKFLQAQSLEHEEFVRQTIRELGEEPREQITRPDPALTPKELLERQLEQERLAQLIHGQAAQLAPTEEISKKLVKISNDEKEHVAIVERILSRM